MKLKRFAITLPIDPVPSIMAVTVAKARADPRSD